MIKRIVDVSEPAYIYLKQRQLLINQEGKLAGQVPIEDLGVLILQHPAIVITQPVIIACQQHNVTIIFCDSRRLPYSSILPIGEGNKLHQKILQQQLAISEPLRKRLWKQIIIHKIKGQAHTLEQLSKDSTQLRHLCHQVKSGDSGNCESIASGYYWKLLFGDGFIRDTNADGINSLLNYGYSIMRAAVARSLCAGGLHPALGLFHHNQYNALCLADDLMEPFRPWVDLRVYQLYQQNPQTQIDRNSKTPLLSLLSDEVLYQGKKMPFLVASHYLIANLKRCYTRESQTLIYPEQESDVTSE